MPDTTNPTEAVSGTAVPTPYKTAAKAVEWCGKAVTTLIAEFQLSVTAKYVRCYIGPPEKRFRARKGTEFVWVFDQAASRDKKFQMFVSPRLGYDDPHDVLATILHGLIHIAVGRTKEPKEAAGLYNHPSEFRRIAQEFGFKAPFPSPLAYTPKLGKRLQTVLGKVGPMPHPELTVEAYAPKQTGRMVRFICRCKKQLKSGDEVPRFKFHVPGAEAAESFNAVCGHCGARFFHEKPVEKTKDTENSEPRREAV